MLRLLMCKTKEEATLLALPIETLNTNRRATDEQITKEALRQIEERKEQEFPATVVFHDDWHKGVVGIVASRVIETHYRPTVVLTKVKNTYVGSVRSVKGFNVYQALAACETHMIQFGGHKYAAGLTLHEDQLVAFKEAFETVVAQTILPEQKMPTAVFDLSLPIEEVNAKLYRIIEQMAPFGPKNMRPVFCSQNCIDNGGSKLVGKDSSHLRLSIQTIHGPLIGIGFGLGKHFKRIQKGEAFDVLYTVDQNEWNGQLSLQLKVKDIRFPS